MCTFLVIFAFAPIYSKCSAHPQLVPTVPAALNSNVLSHKSTNENIFEFLSCLLWVFATEKSHRRLASSRLPNAKWWISFESHENIIRHWKRFESAKIDGLIIWFYKLWHLLSVHSKWQTSRCDRAHGTLAISTRCLGEISSNQIDCNGRQIDVIPTLYFAGCAFFALPVLCYLCCEIAIDVFIRCATTMLRLCSNGNGLLVCDGLGDKCECRTSVK